MLYKRLFAGLLAVLASTSLTGAQERPLAPPAAPGGLGSPTSVLSPEAAMPAAESGGIFGNLWTSGGERGLFESDHAFDGFIGPISNPILAKDPRSLTEARMLFIQDHIDQGNSVGGNFQVYAMQVRVALTDRLTFIADKDGYVVLHPKAGGNLDGWLNLNAGLKYVLIRDVENQFLLSSGFMFEMPTGEARDFNHNGDGIFTFFLAGGKEFCNQIHLLGTVGYQLPLDSSANSTFFYTSWHLDKQIGNFYPLIELNWFHYVASGDHGIPAVLGEGDGLINFGTSGVTNNDLVTMALGAAYRISPHAQIGVAWEVPISNRHDLINNRVTAEFIIRY